MHYLVHAGASAIRAWPGNGPPGPSPGDKPRNGRLKSADVGGVELADDFAELVVGCAHEQVHTSALVPDGDHARRRAWRASARATKLDHQAPAQEPASRLHRGRPALRPAQSIGAMPDLPALTVRRGDGGDGRSVRRAAGRRRRARRRGGAAPHGLANQQAQAGVDCSLQVTGNKR